MQGQEVQGILGIGNYQARTQDITDCNVCRNPKTAYHNRIFNINMKFGLNSPRFYKAYEVCQSMEITANDRKLFDC